MQNVFRSTRLTLAVGAAAMTLAGCALNAPPPRVDGAAPPQWQAGLPHNGSLTDLNTWWQHQGDPLLVRLIDAAQAASPSLAAARARIAQSRAERVAAGAALAPNVDLNASSARSSQQSLLPAGTTNQAALQASWEIDVFGGGRAARDAAQARLDSADAGWHEARVSVAAETASQYYALRACELLLLVAVQDAGSRAYTARLTEISKQAGFHSPSDSAMARASAADGRNRATAQRAVCDIALKSLVALTAIDEPALRAQLAASQAVPAPAIAIAALPAQTLSQRPDVYSAERDVAAASYEVGGVQAQRYPRLSLSGSVGAASFRAGGQRTDLDTWSIGPLAMTLPVFDGGRRRANVDAAQARYDAAVLQYRASVRNAVREVEQAMVTLNSTSARAGDAESALQGYRVAFSAVEDRYKNGLASLFELEDARRLRLGAETTVVTLRQDRDSAWVVLYRAAGGGWNAPAASNQQ
jgi:NodT family efflux transporter outer membrane factor (OMF) lipoprotein